MKSLYRTHLKKELRENRSLLLGLLAVVVFACAAIAIAIEQTKRPTPDAPSFAVLGAMALVAFTLGPESLGREAARNRPAAIARLPGGLLQPFLARITVYITTFVTLSAIAYALEIAFLHLVVTRDVEIAPFSSHGFAYGLGGLGALLALVPGPWLKQTMLGAPAGALLGGSLVGSWLAMPVSGRALNLFFAEQAQSLTVIVIVSALAAAWRGFRSLHTHGGGRAAATIHGALAFFLMSSPVVAYAGYRTYDWLHFPSDARGLRIDRVLPTANGKLLFADMSRGGSPSDLEPKWIVKIDLEQRSIEPVASQAWITSLDVTSSVSTRDRWWLLCRQEGNVDQWSLIDASTGEIESDESDVLNGPLSARLRTALRDNTRLTVNGKRSWLEKRIWMVDGPAGPEVLRDFGRNDFPRIYGNALVVQHDRLGSERSYVIPDTQIAIPWHAKETIAGVFNNCSLLLHSGPRKEFVIRDATGASETNALFRPDEEVVVHLDECRFLVEDEVGRRSSRPLHIVDLGTGIRRTPRFENGEPVTAWFMMFIGNVVAADGRRRPVVYYRNEDGYRVARIDPVTETFERIDFEIGSDGREIAGDGVVFWNSHARTIGRVEFGADRCEILFPFPTE